MPKILLVEDNDMNRDTLARLLGRRGYAVAVAGDGAKAIELAEQTKPDIILMDLDLPIIDGWEATRIIKSAPQTEKIPVLVLTANTSPEARHEAFAAGCDEFSIKPIRLADLVKAMEALLAGGGRKIEQI